MVILQYEDPFFYYCCYDCIYRKDDEMTCEKRDTCDTRAQYIKDNPYLFHPENYVSSGETGKLVEDLLLNKISIEEFLKKR